MQAKVAIKDAESVVTTLIKPVQKLPREVYKSLTWDRGQRAGGSSVFLRWPRMLLFTTAIPSHPSHRCKQRLPGSAWQRGSNENTNRFLRQYSPRGIDLSGHSQAKFGALARLLNELPRRTLHYQTPTEKFAKCVASTG